MEKLAGMKFLDDIESGVIGYEYPVDRGKSTIEEVWKLKTKKERKEQRMHYSAFVVLLVLLGINLIVLSKEQQIHSMDLNQVKQLSWELYDK